MNIPRRALRTLILLVQAVTAWGVVQAAPSAVVTTPQVRAELVAHAPEGVAPGKALWLGLKIDHKPHWHTYWRNPGDSGLPTTLRWQLPAGVAAGDIQWPTPMKLPIGPLMNYGYEGTLLLAVPVTVAAGFSAAALPVRLEAEWLVCKDVCIPESGSFAIDVAAAAATVGHASLFESARQALPRALSPTEASARVEGDALVLTVQGLPAAWRGRDITFLPETAGVIANAAPQASRWDGEVWQTRVPLDPQRTDSPTALPAVLTTTVEVSGLRVTFPVTTPWPGGTLAAAAAPALGNAQVSTAADSAAPSLALALLLALGGGLLLNLMPCVFPVLSLKVIGFTSHVHDRRALLAGGLAYTAGVIVSFMALAGLLLALRAGGEQLGWGFQLQSPAFVAALAALFALIGLNLAGVFEFGSVLPSSWAAAQARHPLVDSALTGVLAVAVASPCTAPFMGASLGVAVTMPPPAALAVFAALGLGMALPYLAASAWPAVARWLPRPGAWMATFKSLMAFPMFATVVWLVWVFGQQAGIDAAAALLGLLVAVALVAWALGSPALQGRTRVGLGATSIVVLVLTALWAVPSFREAPAAAGASAAEAGWQPWAPGKVAELNAQGKTVFVDFTAAWCVTCQYNKRTTLSDPSVVAAFESSGVVRLRADWTRRDAAITDELTRLGRTGVPVYALYAPGAAGPRLLSEILTVQEVVSALPGRS